MTKKFKFQVPESSLLIGPTGATGEPGPVGSTGPTTNLTYFLNRSTGPIPQTSGTTYMLIGGVDTSFINAAIAFDGDGVINDLTVLASSAPVGTIVVSILINGSGSSFLPVTLNSSTSSGVSNIPGGVTIASGQLICFRVIISGTSSSTNISILASVNVTPSV